MKRITRNVGLSAILILSFLAFAVAPVAAQTIAGSRTISDATVAPGDTFTVTVDVGITGTVYGPVLDEDVPAGWTVTEGDDDGGTYHAADTSWLWGGSQNTDKTVIYTVTVPATAADGSYDLTGTVLATVGGNIIGPFGVTGDNSVTVESVAAGTIAGSRTISDATVAPGDTFTVTVDVGITGTVYGPVLDEDVPAGWTVTEGDDDGGTYHAADTSWLWGGSQNTDKTVIYTVTVPATAADGSYDLTGTVLATVGGNIIGPFGVTGDNSVTVESVAAGTIAGSRTISDATVAPGDTFTVTVDVGITGTVYGPVLDEDVPAGWTVTEGDDDGGTYHAADTSWLWGGSQNTDKTVIYTVTVPATAADGSYDLTGTVLATVGGNIIGPFGVTGDNSVTVSDAAPVLTTITVDPATPSIVVGGTQTFTATTLDQYGDPIAATVTWSSSSTTVGTIAASTGVFTAVAAGTTTVTATSGSVTGTASVTVSDAAPVLTTITVDPATPSIVVGGTQTFTATTLDQYGDPIAATVTWSSSSTAVGTIAASTGVFTAVAAGTTTVTATSGSVTGTASVTVSDAAPVLTTITVDPATPSIVVGGTQTFTATTLDQYGDPIAATVTWSSSSTTVGTIAASTGVFTAVAAGTTTVTATSGSVTGTASVTVSDAAPVLTTITVDPETLGIVVGGTQTFTATTLDQYGDPIAATVTWSSSSTTVGTIAASTGVFTAVAAGTTTVTATSGSVTGTASVTVADCITDLYDANDDGEISIDEAIAAINDYFEGDLSKENVIEVIKAYFG